MVEHRVPPRVRERGGIITGWLLQVALFLALLAFVGYEIISVLVTTVSLDDVARDVARSARDEYRVSRSVGGATEVAAETAEGRDARVLGITEDGGSLVVTVERRAPTLLIHRIDAFDGLTTVTALARVTWPS